VISDAAPVGKSTHVYNSYTCWFKTHVHQYCW
jgi:hypothetical protein